MIGKQRYLWVDTLKFLGMVAIYVGHFGNSAGYSYLYVFSYHVPLFFLASGFFANSSTQLSFIDYMKKKSKTILVPYFIFSFIYLFFLSIDQNWPPSTIAHHLINTLLGIRNRTPASALWFLTCLFSINILFYLLKRILKKPLLLLLASIVMFYIGRYISSKFFGNQPSLFFNLDSALTYMFYYVVGSMVFPLIVEISKNISDKKVLIPLVLLFIFTFCTSVCVYFGKTESITYILGFLPSIVSSSFIAFIGIILNIYLSFFLCRFNLLSKLGQLSIFLCGFESLAKIFIPRFLSLIGLSLTITSALSVYFYAILMIFIVTTIFTPVTIKLFPFLNPMPLDE